MTKKNNKDLPKSKDNNTNPIFKHFDDANLNRVKFLTEKGIICYPATPYGYQDRPLDNISIHELKNKDISALIERFKFNTDNTGGILCLMGKMEIDDSTLKGNYASSIILNGNSITEFLKPSSTLHKLAPHCIIEHYPYRDGYTIQILTASKKPFPHRNPKNNVGIKVISNNDSWVNYTVSNYKGVIAV